MLVFRWSFYAHSSEHPPAAVDWDGLMLGIWGRGGFHALRLDEGGSILSFFFRRQQSTGECGSGGGTGGLKEVNFKLRLVYGGYVATVGHILHLYTGIGLGEQRSWGRTRMNGGCWVWAYLFLVCEIVSAWKRGRAELCSRSASGSQLPLKWQHAHKPQSQ